MLRRRTAFVLSAALCLGACAVGPNFKRPAAPQGAGYAPKPLAETTAAAPVVGGDAERFVMGRDIPFAWWKEFGSSKLDALVEKALANNPALPAAQATLRQAQEVTKAQRGYFYPTVGLDFQPTRQQLAGNQGGNAPGIQGNGQNISTSPSTTAPYNQPVTYNFDTAQVGLSYTPDIFGANRRQVETLKAQAEQLRFQMEATYITLADNVVAAALQEASLNDQIEATKRYIDENEQGLKVLQDQFQSGYAGRLDVAAQESALAQSRALLPPLVKQLEVTHDLIRALVGDLPNENLDMTFSLAELRLPRELPVTLPGQLIEQRPDVRAAEAVLHAANAQVGVALADRLPQFTITAAYGGAATEVSQLFAHGGPFWNLLGDVNQTVLDGGTLRHRQRAAEQGLIAARAGYKSVVITSRRQDHSRCDARAVSGGLRQLLDAAGRRGRLPAGGDRAGAGPDEPVRRRGHSVPGPGRRLVEPQCASPGGPVLMLAGPSGSKHRSARGPWGQAVTPEPIAL
jgi:NodT family efflux transporter outer membrane factor (OMF) lipoprotein